MKMTTRLESESQGRFSSAAPWFSCATGTWKRITVTPPGKGRYTEGDIGRLDENGHLWYVRRKAEKDLIKPGGKNVYPSEVEKAILDTPELTEASVIGVRDPE